MTSAIVTLPDGRKAKVSGPDRASVMERVDALRSEFASTQPAPTETTTEDTGLPPLVAEAASALNRGVAAVPDFFVDAGNAALGLAGVESRIPRVQDTLEGVTDGAFGAKNFMEPGLARTVVQEGGEVSGGFLPGAVSAVPELAKTGVKASKKLLEEAAPSIDSLKGAARSIYKQIDDLGIKINAEPVQRLSVDVAKTLKREGHNIRVTPKAQGVIDELADIAAGSPTLSEVDTARKVARQAASSADPAEQRLGKIATEKIDDFINNLPEGELVGEGADRVGGMFSEARGLWSRAKKGEVIEEAFRRADLQASGFENGLRIQFRQLLNNKKATAGFSAEEKAALKKVVQGGSGENFARLIGKFGLEQDQAVRAMLPGLGAFAGASVGGGAGALATPVIGTIAQRIATKMTQDNAKLASALVRAGTDSKKIARAYLASTPSGSRSAEDLTMLLLGREVPAKSIVSALQKSGNQTLRDAAFIVGFISNQTENDLTDDDEDG